MWTALATHPPTVSPGQKLTRRCPFLACGACSSSFERSSVMISESDMRLRHPVSWSASPTCVWMFLIVSRPHPATWSHVSPSMLGCTTLVCGMRCDCPSQYEEATICLQRRGTPRNRGDKATDEGTLWGTGAIRWTRESAQILPEASFSFQKLRSKGLMKPDHTTC